jgi:hypothetical protein
LFLQAYRHQVDDYKNVTLNCGDRVTVSDITNESVFCTDIQDAIVAYVLPIILVWDRSFF